MASWVKVAARRDIPQERFRLRTGELLESPADQSVGTYGVRVSGEDVEVEIQRSS